MKTFLITLLFSSNLLAASNFFTGLSYIQVSNYRVDNEISPLPLGSSILPIISYRGEKLQVLGPNITYSLLKGPVSFALRLNAAGDRYKARNLEQRNSTLNGGFSARLLFLSLSYGTDLLHVYNGNIAEVNLAWRFKLSETLFIIPRVGKTFLSTGFANYYYGIDADEVDSFSEYETNSAVNDQIGITASYKLSEKTSFLLNFTYTVFDRVISNSPTISEPGFSRSSLFWTYAI